MGSQKSLLIEEHRNHPCVAESDIKILIAEFKILIAELRKIKMKKDTAVCSLRLPTRELI